MAIRTWGMLISLFCCILFSSQAQQKYCEIPPSPWILHMIQTKKPVSKVYNIRQVINSIIPMENPYFKGYNQDLHKIKNDLYISIEATGMVYKYAGPHPTRHTLRFERVDSTAHFGYNILCYTFTDNDSLFNLGGYGLWHYTGHLRNFNFKSHEWDIVPLNQEIPVNHSSEKLTLWHDEADHKMYSLHQIYVNQAVRGPEGQNKITDSCMVLDLSTKTWSFAGMINPKIEHFLDNTLRTTSPAGLLIASEYDFNIFDLKNNRILQFPARGILQMLRSPVFKFVSWSVDSTIYFADVQGSLMDSIDLKKTKYTIYKDPIYLPQTSNYQKSILGISVFSILTVVFVYFFKRRKKHTKTPIEVMKPFTAPIQTSSFSPSSPPQEIFTILESALIQLILHNLESASRSSTIEEINHLLGVSNKTLDMQKRKRSNTIKSINEKFAILMGGSDQILIKRVKSETDGRLNEFYIDPIDIEQIKKYIHT